MFQLILPDWIRLELLQSSELSSGSWPHRKGSSALRSAHPSDSSSSACGTFSISSTSCFGPEFWRLLVNFKREEKNQVEEMLVIVNERGIKLDIIFQNVNRQESRNGWSEESFVWKHSLSFWETEANSGEGVRCYTTRWQKLPLLESCPNMSASLPWKMFINFSIRHRSY